MRLSIEADIKKLSKGLNNIQKNQLPFVISKSLNEIGGEVKEAQQNEIIKEIDRPKPFTKNSVFATRTTKGAVKNNRGQVTIGLKDKASRGTPAARYLAPLISGGDRESKPFEYRVRRKIKGKQIGLTSANRRNKFGNVSRKRIKSISDAILNGKDETGKFIFIEGAGLVFETKGIGRANRKLVAGIAEKARYRRQLDLIQPSVRVINSRARILLERNIRLALNTVR